MSRIQRVTYLGANLSDKPGELHKIMKDLKTRNIGLWGLCGFNTELGKAQLFVVTKKPDVLRKVWKDSGLLSEEGAGFFVSGSDRTGALLKPLEALGNSGINIDAIDAIAVGGKFGSFIWVNDQDIDKASTALGAK